MATTLTFAVPVEWDSQRSYEINTIVFIGKRAFTALQDVPAGITINNDTYWAETGVPDLDVSDIRTKLNSLETNVSNLSDNVDGIDTRVTANSGNIATITQELSAATSNLLTATHTLDNIMISLYKPYESGE